MKLLQRPERPLHRHEREAVRVAEFADRLGVSVHTARHWAHSRKIASTKIGKLLFIPVSELDRLIQENMTPALPSTSV
jgi:excisionase family DNA binding protein